MGNFEGEGAARCKVVQGVSAVSCSKTAAPIQMPLGCGSGEPIEACIRWGCTAHWRSLVNTTEPSICGGDVALLGLLLRVDLITLEGGLKCPS